MKGLMSRMESFWSVIIAAPRPKLLVSLLVAALLGGTALTQTAQGSRGFDQRFYGGFGLGVSELDPESMCPCLTVGDGTDQAFTVFLGVDLAKRLTLEGFYSGLGEATVDFNGDEVGAIDYEIAGISAIGYLFGTRLGRSNSKSSALSAREGLSAYIRLGLGVMENDSNLNYDRDHKVHVHTGLGLEYGWTNGFAVRGEISAYDSDAAFAGLSLLKRFGKDKTERIRKVPRANYTVITDPETLKIEPVAAAAVSASVTYFEFGRSDLTPKAVVELDALATTLAARETQTLSIEGHTDQIDSEEFNMMLSINRAAAVKQYLEDKGIDPVRMVISGFGESQPVASNLTALGRSLNRRVEILPR